MTEATETDAAQADTTKSAVPVPLIDGDLYVVQNGRLCKIDRSNDLPKVEVSEDAKYELRALQRRCRRLLRGYRPDIAIVAWRRWCQERARRSPSEAATASTGEFTRAHAEDELTFSQ